MDKLCWKTNSARYFSDTVSVWYVIIWRIPSGIRLCRCLRIRPQNPVRLRALCPFPIVSRESRPQRKPGGRAKYIKSKTSKNGERGSVRSLAIVSSISSWSPSKGVQVGGTLVLRGITCSLYRTELRLDCVYRQRKLFTVEKENSRWFGKHLLGNIAKIP